jgi:L-fuculokinase
MESSSCILIFDIGKTNKKVFVLDESYNLIYEQSAQLLETTDEDGFPCEDVYALTLWVQSAYKDAIAAFGKKIKTVNCAAYGASLVHVDANLKPIAPLYNYLKPFPARLQEKLYNDYGGEEAFTLGTSSPSLGSLNSGLQLYRLKMEQPALFEKIKYSLHLPQYISSIFSRHACSELTSIGCHTALWEFAKKDYHKWVSETGIIQKLAPIIPAEKCFINTRNEHLILAGLGLHDSSAALLTYLHVFSEPFLLISTGTWCISINPFNDHPLTDAELNQDCLCYLTNKGKAVKASRLFTGKWHEEQLIKMATHFHLKSEYFSEIKYRPEIIKQVTDDSHEIQDMKLFSLNLNQYPTAELAYHSLMYRLVKLQAASTKLVLENTDIKNIYVDGGFSKNELFMQLLANIFPSKSVYAAAVSQASAFGAALVIHSKWNKNPIPENLVTLHHYELKTSNLP